MKIISEVVKVFDIEPFVVETEDYADQFQFRLEIVRDLNTHIYHGKVYRLEFYRLQPRFPKKGECFSDDQADEEIYVSDSAFDRELLSGTSVEEVVEKFQKRMDDMFGDCKR